MSDLKQKIQQDLNQAIKSNEEMGRSTLRYLLAVILGKEKEKRYQISKELKDAKESEIVDKSQLTDEEIIDVISSEVKKRREAIAAFEKGNRNDLAQKEKAELEFLSKYLPEQLSEERIRDIVKKAVEKTGAGQIKDMGKVMAQIMPQVKGKADGSLVSKVVREFLSPK